MKTFSEMMMILEHEVKDTDDLRRQFLLIKGNQKVHPSMISFNKISSSDGIGFPGWGESLVIDGEEMKRSSQSSGGFTKRGAEHGSDLVFVGQSGKMEISVAEWIKLAKKGKIIKKEDNKFEILN